MFEIIMFKHSWEKRVKRDWIQVNLTKTLTLKEASLQIGCGQINKGQDTGIPYFLGALLPTPLHQVTSLLFIVLISLSSSLSLLLFFLWLHVAFMQDITYHESGVKLAALTELLTMYMQTARQQ